MIFASRRAISEIIDCSNCKKYGAKEVRIFTEGSNAQVKIRDQTAKLMDDDWWVGSTGTAVAIEIKGFSDLVNDTIGLFVPERY